MWARARSTDAFEVSRAPGPVGFTVETFVDPTDTNKVGIVLEGPSLDQLQSMLATPFAADVMKLDGVRPETITTYVHQG
jgi:hypothetical protein